MHNMRVGVAERLGIDYESARKVRPDIIYVHSTAYGPRGREAKKPGFDPLFQSMSGLTAWNGGRSGGPIFLRTAICDDTNALMLAVAVLMALKPPGQDWGGAEGRPEPDEDWGIGDLR